MKYFNNESKSLNLINKLIEDTKDTHISWDALINFPSYENNPYFREISECTEDKYFSDPHIVLDESFFTKYDSGYFYLFKIIKIEDIEDCSNYEYYTKSDSKYSYYQLAFQPSLNCEIIIVNTLEQFQKELFKLFNILIRRNLKIDSFVDNFLNDKNKKVD